MHRRISNTGLCLIVLSGLLIAPAVIAADPAGVGEYDVKAALLFNFARFVEWPDSSSTAPLVVGVLGDVDVAAAVENAVSGKVIGGRPLIFRGYGKVADISDVDLLFIPRSAGAQVGDVIAALAGKPVLTVGETEGFCAQGGIINFFSEESRIKFEINVEASRAAGLKVSSRLLGLARIVKTDKPRDGRRP